MTGIVQEQLEIAAEQLAMSIERPNAEGRGIEKLVEIGIVALVGIARK
jgi:hypothetical protein